MKNLIDNMAVYAATILVSALPFAVDAADTIDKSKKQHSSMVNSQAKTCLDQDGSPHQVIDISSLQTRFERKID